MTRRTDRRGYSFHFVYDEQGRCVHSQGDDGLFEVFLEYKPELNTTIVRRGDGGQWAYVYDAAGTITQIVDPYGGATKFIVDETGHVTDEIDPNGNVTRLLYDTRGRHYARLDPLGHMLPTYAENSNPSDPLVYELPETPLAWEHGHLLRKEHIYWLAADYSAFEGFPSAVADSFRATHSVHRPDAKDVHLDWAEGQHPPTNDERGRPLDQGTATQLQRREYDPNGNLSEHRDRDGAVYRYEYGSWNALRQQIDPLGHTTLFNQSSQGLVSRVEDPAGTVTEYLYDLKDRLVEIRCDGIVLERYVYDAAKNIVERTDGKGRRLVTWEIGPANLDRVRQLDSSETHTFEYNERGRIVTAVTPDGTVTCDFGKSEIGGR